VGSPPTISLKKRKKERWKTQSRILDCMEVWLGRNVWKIGSLPREKEHKMIMTQSTKKKTSY
jgi:hypothetical protein